jgi:hypothetical protein
MSVRYVAAGILACHPVQRAATTPRAWLPFARR